MSASKAPFSAAEYDRRIRITRQAMAEAGIDVLFITNPSNQNYLTGYDGWSFYVHQGVILTMEGAPYWWGRLQDANGAKRTVWMEHDHILHYADRYIQSQDVHPMEDLASHLRIMGLGDKRIGVEMETYFYTAKAHAVLLDGLPEAEILDASTLVNWQRLIKSDEELAFMRRAARISELVISRAVELAEPGMRKHDLVGELYKTAVQGEEDSWGDYPAIVPLLPSGEDASAPHLTWNGEALKKGEATFIEQSGCYRRYHAPLSRTLFGQAAAVHDRRLRGADRGAEQRHRGGPRRQPCLRHRPRARHRPAEGGHRTPEPRGLCRGPQLPAGLGRTHRVDPRLR